MSAHPNESSVRSRVVEFLNSHHGEWTSGEVAHRLCIPAGKVRSALAQLYTTGKFNRTGDMVLFRYSGKNPFPQMPRPIGHMGVALVHTLGTQCEPRRMAA